MIQDDKSFFAALLTFGVFPQNPEIVGLDSFLFRGLNGETVVGKTITEASIAQLVNRLIPDEEVAAALLGYVKSRECAIHASSWIHT